MSSKAKTIAKNVKEQRNKMYMDNMYELFNLSLFHLLKLRHQYLSYMKARRKEQQKLARAIRRKYGRGKKVQNPKKKS